MRGKIGDRVRLQHILDAIMFQMRIKQNFLLLNGLS